MPNTIKYFEWCWFASLALGVISTALAYQKLAALGAGLTSIAGGVVGLLLSLILVLLVSRRRSKFAKWVLIILFVIGLAAYVPQVSTLAALGFVAILSAVQLLLQCIGLYFLFTTEGREWIKRKDKVDLQSSV